MAEIGMEKEVQMSDKRVVFGKTCGFALAIIVACAFIFSAGCHSRVTDTPVPGNGFGLSGGDTSGTNINGGTPSATMVKVESKIVRLDGTEMEFLDWPYTPLVISIKTTFSEAMNKDAVKNATTLTDAKGNKVAGIFEWADDKTMTFTPQTKAPYRAKLLPKTKYAFKITADAVSVTDNAVEPIDKSFTTMTLGDVNGDGVPDFVVGSLGAAYIYSGDAPTGKDPIATIKAFPSVFSGTRVAIAGDVDGDGYSDVIVGAQEEKINGATLAGAIYFFSGKKLSGTLSASKADAIIEGKLQSEEFGGTIVGAGDINGDGLDDIIVGTSVNNVFIFSGDTLGKMGSTRKSADTVNMAILNGENVTDYFGRSISSIGDVNGDGLADIIIGADWAGNGAGKIYIFSGAELKGTVPWQKAIATLSGAAKSGLGFSVAGVGDVDGDGIGDFLVGLPFADPNVVYLFSGERIGPNLKITDGKPLQPIIDANFGYSLSGIGDINNDGKADFLVGVPTKGRVYLFTGLPIPAKIDLNEPGFGRFVSGIGDVNNDGKPEFVVGSPLQDKRDGAAYVYSISDIDNPVIHKGTSGAGKWFGISVSGASGAW